MAGGTQWHRVALSAAASLQSGARPACRRGAGCDDRRHPHDLPLHLARGTRHQRAGGVGRTGAAARRAGLDARCNDPAVKSQLLQHGEQALAAGVFGVPTLAIDGELFWGFDATDMALDYVADPARFSRGEYARLDALPVGAARKEIS
ncbi:MAG: DsbA family protein [Rhodocyclaceae bacterium]|nr:DsbA family protein [Rhodocyclaceae bacterium]